MGLDALCDVAQTLLTDQFHARLTNAAINESDTTTLRAGYAHFGIDTDTGVDDDSDDDSDDEDEGDADVIVIAEWTPRDLAKRFAAERDVAE